MAAKYVLSLCAAALVSGILMDLNREGLPGQVMKVLCGLFLMLTALGPLGRLSLPDVGDWAAKWQEEAREAVAEGERYAAQNRRTGITDGLDAYILDKAAALGLEVQARVTLSDEELPVEVELTGSPTPAQKRQLEEQLVGALGISKEAVRWKEP